MCEIASEVKPVSEFDRDQTRGVCVLIKTKKYKLRSGATELTLYDPTSNGN